MIRTSVLLSMISVSVAVPRQTRADCTYVSTGNKPLTDMDPATDTYAARGGGAGVVSVGGATLGSPFQGGLYPGGRVYPPAAHLAAALQAASEITPRLADGSPAGSGKIGVIAIGLSNTTHMFSTPPKPMGTPGCVPPGTMGSPCPAPPWMPASVKSSTVKSQLDGDPSKRGEVVLVDGALGGSDAVTWATWAADPGSTDPLNPWRFLASQLAIASPSALTSQQVQVAWIKLALLGPHNFTAGASPSTNGNFPDHAAILRGHLTTIVREVKVLYPNVKIVYLSSRMRGFNPTAGGNREPWSYESAWGVKWLIEDQINDEDSLTFPAFEGALKYSTGEAPVLLWGPYFWADGTTPRSDGRRAICSGVDPFVPGNELASDVRAFNDNDAATDPTGTMFDYTHPGGGGIKKNADQLVAFFKASATTRAWFLAPTASPPSVTMTPAAGAVTEGLPPLTLSFSASGSLSDYAWDFGDGTTARGASPPPKTFTALGSYTVSMTANDAAGNAATQSTIINVVPVLSSGSAQDLSGSAADASSSTPPPADGSSGSGCGCDTASGRADGQGALAVGLLVAWALRRRLLHFTLNLNA